MEPELGNERPCFIEIFDEKMKKIKNFENFKFLCFAFAPPKLKPISAPGRLNVHSIPEQYNKKDRSRLHAILVANDAIYFSFIENSVKYQSHNIPN